MSGMTNPDNGMMENQQAQDLGHPIGEDGDPAVKGASVESPIPRLQGRLDADGVIEPTHEMPDGATEEARRAALRDAQALPRRKR